MSCIRTITWYPGMFGFPTACNINWLSRWYDTVIVLHMQFCNMENEIYTEYYAPNMCLYGRVITYPFIIFSHDIVFVAYFLFLFMTCSLWKLHEIKYNWNFFQPVIKHNCMSIHFNVFTRSLPPPLFSHSSSPLLLYLYLSQWRSFVALLNKCEYHVAANGQHKIMLPIY